MPEVPQPSLSTAFARAQALQAGFFELSGVDNAQIRVRGPSAQVVAKLEWLSRFDEETETLREYFAAHNRFGWLAIGVGAMGILVSRAANGTVAWVLLVLMSAVLIGGIIWARVTARHRAKLAGCDIPDDVGSTLLPLARVLESDMNPDDTLAINADFRRASRPENRVSTRSVAPHPGSRATGDLEERHFVTPVLTVDAEVRGRGKLSSSVKVLRRQRVGVKRSASGKLKGISKSRDRLLIETRLSLPRQLSPPPPGYAKLSTKRTEKRSSILIRRRIERSAGFGEDDGGIHLTPRDLLALLGVIGEAFRQFAAKSA